MKPMFCIEKDTECVNGIEFLKATASEEDFKAYQEALEDVTEDIEEVKLPLYLSIIKYVCFIAAMLACRIVLNAIVPGQGIDTLFTKAPLAFLIFVVCLITALAIQYYQRKRYRNFGEDDENQKDIKDLDDAVKKIFFEMGVPEEANYTEVLTFSYIEKDGKIVPKAKMSDLSEYKNVEKVMYSDGENLCFAEVDGKYEIPISSLKSIKTVKKRIAVPEWNKEESFKKGIYKQYKLTCNQMGMVFMKYFHILEFVHEGETWGVYFPCYELPEYEKLTGLKAEPIE